MHFHSSHTCTPLLKSTLPLCPVIFLLLFFINPLSSLFCSFSFPHVCGLPIAHQEKCHLFLLQFLSLSSLMWHKKNLNPKPKGFWMKRSKPWTIACPSLELWLAFVGTLPLLARLQKCQQLLLPQPPVQDAAAAAVHHPFLIPLPALKSHQQKWPNWEKLLLHTAYLSIPSLQKAQQQQLLHMSKLCGHTPKHRKEMDPNKSMQMVRLKSMQIARLESMVLVSLVSGVLLWTQSRKSKVQFSRTILETASKTSWV